jgi:membrane fusion protein (multidrug efflux system)
VLGLAVAGYFLTPSLITALTTESTDDAYVNGHVTMVAPRVSGQVSKVLVDDNMRVKKGDILVQLDKEPFQVQLDIKKAAMIAAETDLAAARAMVGSQVATLRSQRWKLQYTMEQVTTQIANLKANVATLVNRKADQELAHENLKRAEALWKKNALSKQELDHERAAVKSADAAVEQALQNVYATRVGLGLPAEPTQGHPLTEVPANLEQTFSKVKTALADVLQTAAQLGLPQVAEDVTPEQALNFFKKLHAKGDIDAIFKKLLTEAPAVKQVEARLLQAKNDLAQAELNLHYCDIVSEIDGVITRRNINPGNNVQVGQSLMAVRSLTEIWIDANFKETQLAKLRIGQRVKIEVDMYGSHKEFEGRITGFTMGTGQTLTLLPPQNATGNFVKIVQRLPVKIELTNYDPKRDPLFVGLSVTPYVYYNEPPTGPHAGEVLQPLAQLSTGAANP